VALIATVFDVGIYYLALLALAKKIPAETFRITASNIIGFTAGFSVNFILSRIWVFEEKPKIGFLSELVFIIVISLIGFWINNSIVLYFSQTNMLFQPLANYIYSFVKIPELLKLIAKSVAIVVTFVWNFVARKIVVYRE
jgi:putative flippase GtrA